MTSPATRQDMGRRLIDIVGMQRYLLNHKVEEEALRLIHDGADLTIVDDITGSALCIAAFMGHTNIAQAIVDAKADINAADDMFGMTPLMCATHTGHADIVKLLVDAGAHVLLRDKDGSTALQLAQKCKNKVPAIITMLENAEEEYYLSHHGILKKEFREIIEQGLPTKKTIRQSKLQRKGHRP